MPKNREFKRILNWYAWPFVKKAFELLPDPNLHQGEIYRLIFYARPDFSFNDSSLPELPGITSVELSFEKITVLGEDRHEGGKIWTFKDLHFSTL